MPSVINENPEPAQDFFMFHFGIFGRLGKKEVDENSNEYLRMNLIKRLDDQEGRSA